MHHFPELEAVVSSTDEDIEIQATEGDEVEQPQCDKEEEPQDDEDVIDKDPVLAKEHLDVLLRHLRPEYESKVKPCQQMLKDSTPKIAFNMLWYLYRPGTLVYARDFWTPWYTAVVHSVNSLPGANGADGILALSVWALSSDGARIGRLLVSATIHPYEGLKEVTSLSVCPVEYWDAKDGGARRKDAIRRGKLLEKAFRKGHLTANYKSNENSKDIGHGGRVVVDHRRGQDLTGLSLHPVGLGQLIETQQGAYLEVNDRYAEYDNIYVNRPWNWGPDNLMLRDGKDDGMITTASQRKNLPLTAALITEENKYHWSSTLGEDEPLSGDLTEEQLMLMYPLTFGFSLSTKMWLELDASRLEEIVPSSDSLNNLVLAPDTMRVVEAIASRLKKSDDTWCADHIEGKGSGGIILLHGPPGVGKTFTVECIAEYLKRPLLALTVADLGTTETMIEHELSKWFELANLWKAVLLIDEADIFLERRQTKDLQRNGLVSAFLRRVEYFKGLLFLTTNRVGQIDDAFISRIQIPIHYRPLDGEALGNIWEGFFRKLARDKSIRVQVDLRACKWVVAQFKEGKYDGLNGRDIRNAMQTAITLAEYEYEQEESFDPATDKVVVSKDHFEKVLDMSYQFRAYVSSIRREDERKRANSRGDRNDYPDSDGEMGMSVRASMK